jgi:asparagine synthase (glutamine-hydrolysing)
VRMFAGAVRLDGGVPPMSFRAAVRGAPYCKDHQLRWVTADGLIAVVGPESGACPPAIVRSGSVTVVGMARVDNRSELLKLLGDADPRISDLALVGEMALRRRTAGVARILGDFAFVVWEADTRTLMAARDTFGVKQLYYASPSPGVVTFSSRAELLAQGDDYNIEYLAAWVSYCAPDPSTTVYPRVAALPAASVLRYDIGLPRVERYWSAQEVQAQGSHPGSESDQIDEVRQLLIDGVGKCLTEGNHTWAQLSGGLDSSSIVGTAQWLASRGDIREALGGTVSFVDSIGTAADERYYSDAVAAHWGVRNCAIPHQLDRRGVLARPPRFDQPGICSYTVADRDRAVADTVTGAGGSVLLTGSGGDNLFLGTMFFFADWVARGQLGEAVREMAHRAALGRVSFWDLAYQNAVLPLLPSVVRRRLMRGAESTVPAWVNPHLVRQYGLDQRTGSNPLYTGPARSKYAFAVATAVDAIPTVLTAGVDRDVLDIRHPFLHRPLVEVALRLPAQMCVRPHARKWVLRQAMRGILPEMVRTRVGKGNGGGLSVHSLHAERVFISRLLHDSILAALGVINLERVKAATAMTHRDSDGQCLASAMLQSMVDLEFWLQVRSGRWGPDINRGQQAECCSSDNRNVHSIHA